MISKQLPKITPGCGEYYNKWVGCDKELLAKSKYIYLDDHMPPSFDFKISIDHKLRYFKNSYADLLESIGVDYKNKIFLVEGYHNLECFEHVLPDISRFYFLNSAVQFLNKFSTFNKITFKPANKKFSFMANKPRPQRMLISAVCANLFDSNTINYTFIDHPIQNTIVDELLIDTEYNLTNKFLKQKWIRTENSESLYNLGINYKNFCEVYAKLKNSLFDDTCTSIISEPAYYEQGNQFSEKTIMSIYSGHFLIWPGMYKSAETFQNMGFDIFEDIIDHSYQYLEHPGRRIVEAFLRNMNFLNDVDLQNKYREQMLDRLNYNLQLIRNPEILKQNIIKLQIGSVPLDYHAEMHKLDQYLNTL